MANFTEELLKGFELARVELVSGVPDGVFSGVIRELEMQTKLTYVACAREEECLGVAGGSALGGATACAIMQSAGLLNSIGAFATFLTRYALPIPIITSNRGALGDSKSYDIEKFMFFKAVDAMPCATFRISIELFSSEDIAKIFQWCNSAQKPAILALEGAPYFDAK